MDNALANRRKRTLISAGISAIPLIGGIGYSAVISPWREPQKSSIVRCAKAADALSEEARDVVDPKFNNLVEKLNDYVSLPHVRQAVDDYLVSMGDYKARASKGALAMAVGGALALIGLIVTRNYVCRKEREGS